MRIRMQIQKIRSKIGLRFDHKLLRVTASTDLNGVDLELRERLSSVLDRRHRLLQTADRLDGRGGRRVRLIQRVAAFSKPDQRYMRFDLFE